MRLGIVTPRYGLEVLGGAETAARTLAEHLPPDEFQVEVLTTCARDMTDWRNIYPAGPARVNGIPVLRFPVDHRMRDPRRYHELTLRFMNHWPSTVDQEYDWIDQNAHSPELYAHLARHGPRYDFLVFVPYLFGTTFYGTTLYPEKSIVWPCLHDERFAQFQATRVMLESCRGIMFISEPEQTLALSKLGVRHRATRVVGVGVDDFAADGERFRRQYNIIDPFIFYAGRLDSQKNVLTLFNYFDAYKQARPGSPLKLVVAGSGPVPLPKRPDIVPLGFVPEQDKRDAFAAATLFCLPSKLESFSIAIMEAWLAGAPVLVHGDCDVTRYHVLRSNGGLYFLAADDWAGAVDWFLEQPDLRAKMGQLGRAYVLREYNWNAVLARFRDAIQFWKGLA